MEGIHKAIELGYDPVKVRTVPAADFCLPPTRDSSTRPVLLKGTSHRVHPCCLPVSQPFPMNWREKQ